MSEIADRIAALPPLRDTIREHGLRAEKSLGQNFLLDLNLTAKIARAAVIPEGGTVFEIGPGPGGLTRALSASGAAKVIAIEYDSRAIAALRPLQEAADGVLEIVEGDALHADLPALAAALGGTPPFTIVANLPYNIATPLLTGWMKQVHEHPARYRGFVLMFQKEVAQRIAARPSSPAYGRLAVLCQWLCEAKTMFDVPASAFTPPPKVTSSIVRLVPKDLPAEKPDFVALEKITAAAFGQRRKMIRGSLKDYLSFVRECGLREEARAEELAVEDFVALARLATKDGGGQGL